MDVNLIDDQEVLQGSLEDLVFTKCKMPDEKDHIVDYNSSLQDSQTFNQKGYSFKQKHRSLYCLLDIIKKIDVSQQFKLQRYSHNNSKL